MKIQKQIVVSEYRGYQFRKSLTTWHVTIYDNMNVHTPVRIVARNSMALAMAYVDRLIESKGSPGND